MTNLTQQKTWFDRINFLKNFKVAIKLSIASGLLFVLLGFSLFKMVSNENEAIDFSQTEYQGTLYINPVYELVQSIMVHRGQTNSFLNGDLSAKAQVDNAKIQVNTSFKNLESLLASEDTFSVFAQVKDIKNDWNRVSQMQNSDNKNNIFNEHSKLITDVIGLITHIANQSNLTLDPEIDTYYLMDLTTFKGHELADYLGQIRGLGAGMLANGNQDLNSLLQLSTLMGKVNIDAYQNSFNSAVLDNSNLELALGSEIEQTIRSIRDFNLKTVNIINGTSTLTSAEFFDAGTTAVNSVFDNNPKIIKELDSLILQRIDNLKSARLNMILLLTIGVVVAMAMLWMTIVSITSPLKNIIAIFDSISNGNYQNEIKSVSKDELGILQTSLRKMQHFLNEKDIKDNALSAEMARIKQSLDACTTSVMIADPDLNIIYMNGSASTMMHDAEDDIKLALPNFRTDKLIGENIDVFHKKPGHQRELLKGITSTYTAMIKVGTLDMRVIATPVFDDNGEKLGFAVEWSNLTEQIAKEKEEKLINDSNERLKQALDVCNTSVMVADPDLNIIYLNQSTQEMMNEAESDIKKALPNFSAKNLMGTNIDSFHVNPAHQRGLLKTLDKTYTAGIKVGTLDMQVVATPINNSEGERIGYAVEWQNQTQMLAREKEEKQINDSNERLKQALDVCNTSVMVADPDLNIIYMNQSTQEMMNEAESDIKKALPNFSAKNLMGENIDSFHVNPSHQRELLKTITKTYTAAIKVGTLDMQVVATPINNSDGERIGYAVEWQNQTQMLAKQREEKRIADENSRIKQALDNVTTNAMIADNDRNIVYMNKSVTKMMKEREAILKEVLPNFNASNLMQERIDVFHKNPAHQENLLKNLTSTYSSQIVVNGLTFRLTANPVYDENNNRIGSVVEWDDRTAEVSVEQEIDQLVESAANGDLTARIDLLGKEGFFEKLGVGLNRLLGISEGVVNDTARVLDALAHGDLSQKIDQEYQGSFGKLKQDANATVDKLTEIITAIRDAASSVSTGADEIAQGNTDLSQRTEEQASSLEETASSMEEMTSTVRQSAENAGKANTLSREAAEKALEGGAVVKEAVTAMAEINDSSKKISDIIGVIDEIAFQTNLLALNAAVEAARAGEQGRGFAVVAGEVRSLAQRSAGAAKEIKDLIRDSGEKVDAGTNLVNKSGETLKDIVDSVQKVSSMIADITDASEEQASGIDQVNKAVSQMDEMTQQNAALVEEATSAGEAMSEQARSMLQLMKFFSTDGTEKMVSGQDYQQASHSHSSSAVKAQSLRKPMEDPGDQWQEF